MSTVEWSSVGRPNTPGRSSIRIQGIHGLEIVRALERNQKSDRTSEEIASRYNLSSTLTPNNKSLKRSSTANSETLCMPAEHDDLLVLSAPYHYLSQPDLLTWSWSNSDRDRDFHVNSIAIGNHVKLIDGFHIQEATNYSTQNFTELLPTGGVPSLLLKKMFI